MKKELTIFVKYHEMEHYEKQATKTNSRVDAECVVFMGIKAPVGRVITTMIEIEIWTTHRNST